MRRQASSQINLTPPRPFGPCETEHTHSSPIHQIDPGRTFSICALRSLTSMVSLLCPSGAGQSVSQSRGRSSGGRFDRWNVESSAPAVARSRLEACAGRPKAAPRLVRRQACIGDVDCVLGIADRMRSGAHACPCRHGQKNKRRRRWSIRSDAAFQRSAHHHRRR